MSPYKAHGDLDSNSWNETRGLDMETSVEYCHIPDVDNDSIPDGKEIHGYEVKIITGWKSDGTPISEMRFISADELDPLTPYANETGVYTDSDEDGIPDIAESMLSNRSKWGEFQKDYPDLWSEYSWISSYYDTVTRNQNESAAKQWLQNQFNPLIRDRTPPMITTFNLWWEVEYSLSLEPVKVYAHVHIVVRDAGGISYLHVVDEDSGEDVAIYNAGTVVEVDHKFRASALSAVFGSVHIRLTVQDYVYNTLTAEKELKGAFEQVLDALAKMWKAIWNTLCKVAEAVMKALDVIWNWLVSLIKSVIQTLLSPIWNAWNAWVTKMNALVEELIPSRQEAVVNENEWMREFTNLLLYSPFAMLVQALSWGIIGLEWTIFAISCVAGGAGAIASVFAELLSTVFKSVTAMWLIGIIGSVGIGYVMGLFVPLNNTIWNITLNTGTTLFVLISSLIVAILEGKETIGLGDAIGLWLSLTGFFWGLFISNITGTTAQMSSLISLAISISGLLMAVVSKDLPPPPIGWIDEFIDAICVGINGAIAKRLIMG